MMRHTMRTFLLLALAGVAVAAAAYGAVRHKTKTSVRKVDTTRDTGRLGPALFGFNDNSVLFGQLDPETALRLNAAAGANVIRYTVNWDYVEQTRGQPNWHGYDPLYASALRRGIRPILTVAFAPGWARPGDLSCGPTNIDHCHNPPNTNYDGAWVRFVADLAKRYPKAAAIEIWNEPNLSNFWKRGPSAERYAHLLNLAYEGIKKAEPEMRVLGGALSNSEFGGDGSVPYESYIKDLLARRPRLDALSIHSYDTAGTSDDWFGKTVSIARDALDDNGYKGMPLWVTEIGRSTTGERAVDDRTQSDRLRAMLSTLGARRDVQAGVVHTLIPAPTGTASEEYGYAVLNADGSPKPAYCALARGRRAPTPKRCAH